MTGPMKGAMAGDDLAARACALTGTPFRLHGRDPRTGLDCIGLLAAALGDGAAAALPKGYTLRSRRLPPLAPVVERLGLTRVEGDPVAGDVLLLRVSPVQHHLAIALDRDTIVHAHAGLRRVVVSALPDEWPVAGHWRLDSTRN